MLQFFVVFLKCTLEKGLGCFQHVKVEVEAIKSEVHLNCPVDIKRRKRWDQVKKSTFKVQKKPREELGR